MQYDLQIVDVEKHFRTLVENSYSTEDAYQNSFEKIYKHTKVDISLHYVDDEYRLYISYNNLTVNNEELQQTTTHAFKRIDGKLKLYSTYCIGSITCFVYKFYCTFASQNKISGNEQEISFFLHRNAYYHPYANSFFYELDSLRKDTKHHGLGYSQFV